MRGDIATGCSAQKFVLNGTRPVRGADESIEPEVKRSEIIYEAGAVVSTTCGSGWVLFLNHIHPVRGADESIEPGVQRSEIIYEAGTVVSTTCGSGWVLLLNHIHPVRGADESIKPGVKRSGTPETLNPKSPKPA